MCSLAVASARDTEVVLAAGGASARAATSFAGSGLRAGSLQENACWQRLSPLDEAKLQAAAKTKLAAGKTLANAGFWSFHTYRTCHNHMCLYQGTRH